ncbi:hypothetical protein L914_10034 [Phytophthora nicotianae]|uniref:Uncharacterized protein n=1 Tax=Phytophthora nicotianae TaxID=4792 RepID=W2N8C0_PHYNI|nr:hypothetical protein L914_10034 [Phytophthora nicotianae]
MKEYEVSNGNKGMFAKSVNKFPAIFNSATRAANLAKALDWWNKRYRIQKAEHGSVSISARRGGGGQRVSTKPVVDEGDLGAPE